MSIEGKRILITGASRGIGRELAERASKAGARPILVARDKGAIEDLAARASGRAYAVDLADPRQIEGIIDRIEQDAGPVDVLVNNAGFQPVGYFPDSDVGEIERAFRINVLAPMLLAHQVIPRMLSRGAGHIVNVSSVGGIICLPGLSVYSTTKAALTQFTGSLRADLRDLPIKVTLVELGAVATEMYADASSYAPLHTFGERTGMSATLPVAEVADAILAGIREGQAHVRLPESVVPMCEQADKPRADIAQAFIALGVPPRP